MFSGKGSLSVPVKPGMMSEASATLAYLGPDVDDGSMDVADLAPALLAASRLITSANRALNGDRADVRVRVAALRTGSFEIELQVVTSLWEQTKALLSQDDITSGEGAARLDIRTDRGRCGGIPTVPRPLPSRQANSETRPSR